ncbi:adenosine deaminase [Candidatus Uhrbacteria bacterium]|nr:adenosine deaminase [Candidatus Uhrbacteria bacterium]
MPFQRALDPTKRIPLAELHSHLGGAVDSAILWTLAHQQGIKLPTKNYWEFDRMVTISTDRKKLEGVTALDKEKYHWTELIQSSPLAMEPTVHETIGGAYRANHVVVHEIRYNPMKRNRGGERDLDHIILSSIRGMEQATLEYEEVRAGIILLLDRTFPFKLNEIIYQKTLKYQHRGVVGIDIAGPQHPDFRMQEYADLFQDAKRHGLGVTIHTGEEGDLSEMKFVVEKIQPQRIGHGFLAAHDRALLRSLVEQGIVLELCPTSNLNIGTIASVSKLKKMYRALYEARVELTINTDGPEMYGTTLWKEFNFLRENGVFTEEELSELRSNAMKATFVPANGSVGLI